jgi:micrococcal nuclease
MSFKKPFRAEPIRPGNVYKARFSRQRQRRTVQMIFYAAVAFAMGALISAAIIAPPSLSLDSWGITQSDEPPQARHFGFCHTGGGTNCVVDGDTIWMDGTKIRVADIDAPETHPSRCPREAEVGNRATQRLHELVNLAPFTADAASDRDEDRYGRKLRVLRRNGQSLGGVLVQEGLARPWDGSRHPWC